MSNLRVQAGSDSEAGVLREKLRGGDIRPRTNCHQQREIIPLDRLGVDIERSVAKVEMGMEVVHGMSAVVTLASPE